MVILTSTLTQLSNNTVNINTDMILSLLYLLDMEYLVQVPMPMPMPIAMPMPMTAPLFYVMVCYVFSSVFLWA